MVIPAELGATGEVGGREQPPLHQVRQWQYAARGGDALEGRFMRKVIGRRSFLQRSAGGALAAVTAPAVVSANQGQTPPRPAPSDRVVVGLIGLGVRGRDHHLRFLSANPRTEIAAVCDVDRNRADWAAQIATRASRKKPLVFHDFRDVLDRKELDAVVIATPDHWHCRIVLDAPREGGW